VVAEEGMDGPAATRNSSNSIHRSVRGTEGPDNSINNKHHRIRGNHHVVPRKARGLDRHNHKHGSDRQRGLLHNRCSSPWDVEGDKPATIKVRGPFLGEWSVKVIRP
jgi:hypothetical protein